MTSRALSIERNHQQQQQQQHEDDDVLSAATVPTSAAAAVSSSSSSSQRTRFFSPRRLLLRAFRGGDEYSSPPARDHLEDASNDHDDDVNDDAQIIRAHMNHDDNVRGGGNNAALWNDSSVDGSLHHHNRSRRGTLGKRTGMIVLLVVIVVFLVIAVTPNNKSDNNRSSSSSSSRNNNNNSNDNDDTTCRSADDPLWNSKFRATSVQEGFGQAAVATDHPVCSQMGAQILMHAGGNAVDAAVTVALCLGVANPASSGLGGGGFMLLHMTSKNDENNTAGPDTTRRIPFSFEDARTGASPQAASGKITEVIDCREVAPAAASTDMYTKATTATGGGTDKKPHVEEDASVFGGLSIPVPAELRGLELAHARHGKLSWAQVVQPVVQLARQGVVVNANLEHEIARMAKYYTTTSSSSSGTTTTRPDYGMRALLTHQDDWSRPLVQGDVLKNAKLAETLQAVMKGGSNALYRGARAAQLAREIQNAGGGIVTATDIETYQPVLRSPVMAHNVWGLSLVGIPPPSSGGATVLGAARFLAEFVVSYPFAYTADTLSVHRLVEACKHAFAIRMSLSDPAERYNHSAQVTDAVHDLVQGPYMSELQRHAYQDNETLPVSRYGGVKWSQLQDDSDQNHQNATDANEGDRDRRHLYRRFGYLEDGGTSHFSIVDAAGNAVAMTTSVNTYFGSKVVSPSTGIIFSNTMDDFANPGRPNTYGLSPSEANYIQPGKRPLSSMSPTLVFRQQQQQQHNNNNDNNNSVQLLGDLALVLGASGGPKIITAVLQVLVHVVLLGMPLFTAMSSPRVHEQLVYHGSTVTTTEHGTVSMTSSPSSSTSSSSSSSPATTATIQISQRTRDALTKRGHALLDINYAGTVQAIVVDPETKTLAAGSDIRKGGSPAGY